MLEIHKNEWMINAHKAIVKELSESFNNQQQDSWSENHITTRMLMALLDIGQDIKWTSMSQRVKWDSFKLKGKRETELGDIAFFMKVMLTSEVYLEGVVFYEAKRQYYDEEHCALGFNSIKLEQLTRIQKITNSSNILLYDVDIKNEIAGAFALPTIFVEKIINEAPLAVPGRILTHHANPWVKSLAENFSGFGLDYSQGAVSKMKGILKSSEQPLHIINASASMLGIIEPELDNSFVL
ncbi:hypothetical protein PB16LOC_04522 [Pectobacterium versatile]|uniref:hypothetical protein n=1 Tax=Pectobacterium versatile TaxID=2488639 RepID=UPI000FB7EDE0|nr:hypothetical protein [Pectobacterium versatile]RUR87267.1 hypothetical protein PB16LOC_04522 [Pectobacterium versatile]